MPLLIALALTFGACGGSEVPLTTTSDSPPLVVRSSSSVLPDTSTSTTALSSTTTPATAEPPSTTAAAPVDVARPGSYESAQLRIRIRFDSRVDYVSDEQLASQALAILNDSGGWNESGFTFVVDDSSELAVILADGDVVDALCLPLDTYGKVSCQNGAVVALNADRWRLAGDDWDGTIDSYRTYLINHEVGHLIGLRHPVERCPTDSKVSALMEPQTNNLLDCVGNGIPLGWELEWAANRPAMVGPEPSWDGPRPSWPDR
ncbi:MAG: DUF3152 domain-containing protein [Acidimicrobiia bacterium]|nr:DUF3152 domain-containing protein [Acidimicrobiia bacterium]